MPFTDEESTTQILNKPLLSVQVVEVRYESKFGLSTIPKKVRKIESMNKQTSEKSEKSIFSLEVWKITD